MKKLLCLILLFAANAAHAADMYKCETKHGMAYQSMPCDGDKISFSAGTLVIEGAKLEDQFEPTTTALAIESAAPEPNPSAVEVVPTQKTIEWALDLYDVAGEKARQCQQSLQQGQIKPCIEFASFTQGDSDFMNAYQYLSRYGEEGLDNILHPRERNNLAKNSTDILEIAGQLEKMIQLVAQ